MSESIEVNVHLPGSGRGDVWSPEALKKLVADFEARGRPIIGQFEPPSDTKTHLNHASHEVIGMRETAGRLIANIRLLDTNSGKLVRRLISAGARVDVGLRAIGSVDPNGVVDAKSLHLVSVDILGSHPLSWLDQFIREVYEDGEDQEDVAGR